MKFSIHSRILFSALLILILFMGLTGFILDKTFRSYVKNAQQESLRTQIYTLLATAEINDVNLLQLPEEITEPRLNISESNLHARVIKKNGEVIWQSKSMLNIQVPFTTDRKVGKFSFFNSKLNDNIFSLVNFTTLWVTDIGEQTYTFQVAENNKITNKQITLFRQNLWGWLSGVSLILIIIQTFILRWGLKPLRYVAEDLIKIEEGNERKLSGQYPKEITPLTNNLNQLLDSSQQQLTRYRDALGNMAHSLKTPIAVLQGIINSEENNNKEVALEQLNTINKIVEYQLQRAATVGQLKLSDVIDLQPVAKKIINTLDKVHKDKSVKVNFNISPETMLNVNQGDLYELMGNLLENAFKWCNQQIAISAEIVNDKTIINIEDDGPGINDGEKKRILLRGQRADQNTPGHGLGLAMVSEMLLLYSGSLEITKSSLGGAKITIKI